MKLLSSNFNKSIRKLPKTVPNLLTRLQKMTSRVWQKVKGEQKCPITESFVTPLKVSQMKNIQGSGVDFDRIRREFDSRLLRKAMDNNESAFFEDDFVSSADWAAWAVKEQESLHSIIMPIIKDCDDIESSLTFEIQEELRKVKPKLQTAEEKAAQSILVEQQSHKDALLNLQKEKEAELQNRLNTLEQEFKAKERKIFNFKSLRDQTSDQFIKEIAHANARIQDEKIAKRAEKIVKKNKKFVSSVVKESSQRLNQEFKIQSSKIYEKINEKFQEKENFLDQTFKEKLESIQENLLKEKKIISDLSAKHVNSLQSKVQRRREQLENQLQNPRLLRRDSQELDISPQTWEEMVSVLKESPLSKEKTEAEEETSEDLFGEFPPNWFDKFQENIESLEQEESDTDSKELLEKNAEMQPISFSDSLQNLDNHPSVIEAKKLMENLEKDYERRMTEVCQVGENRLQAFKKEKNQRILDIENSLQHNLKVAQEVAAKPREKAEEKLAKIIQAKKNSTSLQSLFRRCQKSIAEYQLKKAKDKEFRIIDAAFEKNHLLRDEGIQKIKKETEGLEQQVLQQTESERKKELSRFRKLQNKIDGLIQTLQTSPWIEEISIL